jgi:hypothetical protein
MLLRPDGRGTGAEFAWETLPELIGRYEEGAGAGLVEAERRALGPYVAAVPIYLAALAGHVEDPIAHLRNQTRLTFLRIAEWLLDNPEAARG